MRSRGRYDKIFWRKKNLIFPWWRLCAYSLHWKTVHYRKLDAKSYVPCRSHSWWLLQFDTATWLTPWYMKLVSSHQNRLDPCSFSFVLERHPRLWKHHFRKGECRITHIAEACGRGGDGVERRGLLIGICGLGLAQAPAFADEDKDGSLKKYIGNYLVITFEDLHFTFNVNDWPSQDQWSESYPETCLL